MATPIVYPKNPREYLHDGGAELVDQGYKWAFGLPQDGTLSSQTCGALPFRQAAGLSGINKPEVLRGEDWEFLYNWSIDRSGLYDSFFWADEEQNIDYNMLYPQKGPRYEQLSSMYTVLSSLRTVYGSDFQLVDQEISSEAIAPAVIKSSFVPCQQVAPMVQPAARQVLALSNMTNFFADTAKLSCTVADVVATMQDGGQSYGAELFYFWQRDGQPATIESHFLSSVYLNIDWLYSRSTNPDRVVLFDVQLIALLQCSTADSDNGTRVKYALANLQTRQPIQQRIGSSPMFRRLLTWGGNTAADLAAGIVGEQARPTPPQYGWASFTCQLRGIWAVVWPYYLQINP